MVDQGVLRRRLEALLRFRERLRPFETMERKAFVEESRHHDLAERYLHLVTEAAIDIANHLIADAGYEAPETYRSTFDILARHGVIPADLSRRLQAWAGLRNVLVHLYLDIDHELTHEAIQNDLGDLEAFAASVAALLECED